MIHILLMSLLQYSLRLTKNDRSIEFNVYQRRPIFFDPIPTSSIVPIPNHDRNLHSRSMPLNTPNKHQRSTHHTVVITWTPVSVQETNPSRKLPPRGPSGKETRGRSPPREEETVSRELKRYLTIEWLECREKQKVT